jgi:class 3 adenylate cyclase
VLYERRGDAPAFALVQDHFEIMTEVIRRNAGGVVKTIGDAVMAVFQSAGSAARAALEILSSFERWNETHPPEQLIVIKLGMHRGPCLALNLNDKLDYFGQTVNKAARIQGQSVGGDVVLSRELYEDPDVAEELAGRGRHAAFSAELKGISGHAELVRVTLA